MKKKTNLVLVSAVVIVTIAGGLYVLSTRPRPVREPGGQKQTIAPRSDVNDFIHGRSDSLAGYDPAMNK